MHSVHASARPVPLMCRRHSLELGARGCTAPYSSRSHRSPARAEPRRGATGLSESSPSVGQTPLDQGYQPSWRGSHGSNLLRTSRGIGCRDPAGAGRASGGLGSDRAGQPDRASGSICTAFHQLASAGIRPRGSSVARATRKPRREVATVSRSRGNLLSVHRGRPLT